MAYGAVLARGERYYTDLNRIFAAIGGRQREYNWLIADWQTNLEDESILNRNGGQYCWMTGDELTELVERSAIQWIWASLSAFPKEIELDAVLKEPLPRADSPGVWEKEPLIQHPLAVMEIIPFDSSMAVLLGKDREIIDLFRKNCPQSESMAEYIHRKA